jgi:hypothetical protein
MPPIESMAGNDTKSILKSYEKKKKMLEMYKTQIERPQTKPFFLHVKSEYFYVKQNNNQD